MAEFTGARIPQHALKILDALTERGITMNRSDGVRQGILLLAEKYGIEIPREDVAVPA